jgi:predicted secreted protein
LSPFGYYIKKGDEQEVTTAAACLKGSPLTSVTTPVRKEQTVTVLLVVSHERDTFPKMELSFIVDSLLSTLPHAFILSRPLMIYDGCKSVNTSPRENVLPFAGSEILAMKKP